MPGLQCNLGGAGTNPMFDNCPMGSKIVNNEGAGNQGGLTLDGGLLTVYDNGQVRQICNFQIRGGESFNLSN